MVLIYGKKSNNSYTVNSRSLKVQGPLLNTPRYPYLNISDLQNWGKNKSNTHSSYYVINM